MIRQFTPLKDASVYGEFPDRNTGTDEILEFGKNASGAHGIRSIIAFDFDAARALVATGSVYILRLHTAFAERVQKRQEILVGAYSGSWEEGTGYFYQDIYQVPDGVLWDALTGSHAPSASHNTSHPWTDLAIDVTALVSSSADLTGLVLQFPSASEADIDNKGNIRVFSGNTHTVYAPILEVRWVDQIYQTGSLSTAASKHINVIPHTLLPAYSQNEMAQVDLTVREKYPLKTFVNYLNQFVNSLYLPSSSYFSVIDDATGFVVIPFSAHTAIHQTESGSYCKFKVENMYPRRFYRLVIKTVFPNGEEKLFDNNSIFAVR